MPPDETPAVVVNEASPAEAVEAAATAEVAHAEARIAEAEAHAEAAVAIAETEAAASVQREEIAAEAAVEIATAISREEMDTCLRNLETISTNLLSTQQRLEALERHPNLAPPSTEGTHREDGSKRTEASGQAPADAPPQSPVLAAEHQSPPEPPKKRSGVRWT